MMSEHITLVGVVVHEHMIFRELKMMFQVCYRLAMLELRLESRRPLFLGSQSHSQRYDTRLDKKAAGSVT